MRHREDTPGHLELVAINEAPALFQPRFESIAYAPGRSEGHVAELGAALERGEALDPATVVAFGDEWFLVDGHHRLAAYRSKGWDRPVPVAVAHSPLTGDARIEWAAQLSVAENKKTRLAMSGEDKADAAWRATVTGAGLSKSAMARAYGVGVATIGNMRRTLRELTAQGAALAELERLGWRRARAELAGGREGTGAALSDRAARILGRKLAPAMGAAHTPAQLATALEAFSPGIVRAMYIAQGLEERRGGEE